MQTEQCKACKIPCNTETNTLGFEIQNYEDKTGWTTQKPAEFKDRCEAEKALLGIDLSAPENTSDRRVYVSLKPFVKKRATDFM